MSDNDEAMPMKAPASTRALIRSSTSAAINPRQVRYSYCQQNDSVTAAHKQIVSAAAMKSKIKNYRFKTDIYAFFS
ncbi:MAG: hypothetical protein ACKOPO_11235 [Novosphingobium sp.]